MTFSGVTCIMSGLKAIVSLDLPLQDCTDTVGSLLPRTADLMEHNSVKMIQFVACPSSYFPSSHSTMQSSFTMAAGETKNPFARLPPFNTLHSALIC